jgi:hypothetical protein
MERFVSSLFHGGTIPDRGEPHLREAKAVGMAVASGERSIQPRLPKGNCDLVPGRRFQDALAVLNHLC